MARQTILLTIQVISLCFLSSGCTVNNKNTYLSNPTLESGKWILVNLHGKEVSPQNTERPLYLEFDATHHKVAGFGGCNRVFGAYTSQGNSIAFARISSTKLICPEAHVENDFLKILQKVNRYQIDRDNLNLFDKTNLLVSMRLLSD